MSAEGKNAFFRQSGWMVVATFAGGVFMTLVHSVARNMGPEDYSTFVALLRLLIILGIPAAALQTVFAQQAAAATSEEKERQLSATARAIFQWTLLIWLVVAVAALASLPFLSRLLKVSNPAAVCLTLAVGLTSLWGPVVRGLLQGKHHFNGLGWVQILDGVGRFTVTLVAVEFLGGKAASAMGAALFGQSAALLAGAWMTREIWTQHRGAVFNWRSWSHGALPLTLGLGTVLLMSSIDMVFVQSLFTNTRQTALYGGAMLTGFAIIQFIAPVTTVMFPRIVRAVAQSQATDGMKMTLAATALFGCVAAVGCTLFPKLPLRLMYFKNPEMLAAAPLVPWFAWALLPLTAANVLVQNVLARSRFEAAYWMALTPIAYTAALCLQAPHLVAMPPFNAFIRIIQTLGLSCLALCAVAAWFCRGPVIKAPAGPGLAPALAASGKSNSPAA
ncbi:MAG TPA: oligosaccharide flippase family protein [Verrucomicrobiae bacterium]|jgi:O-antigen/teichoic acid export membrane protein|nr:oligosaccharide flippase family protein [Verrucomicrobiae bacterium]